MRSKNSWNLFDLVVVVVDVGGRDDADDDDADGEDRHNRDVAGVKGGGLSTDQRGADEHSDISF